MYIVSVFVENIKLGFLNFYKYLQIFLQIFANTKYRKLAALLLTS